MKLIIEIEEKTYRRIQALVNADYFEHDICGYSMQRIANGIPIDNAPTVKTNIDSNELVKHFESGCNTCKEKDTEWCKQHCFVTHAVDTIESFVDTKQ